jgi:hypothetical protein
MEARSEQAYVLIGDEDHPILVSVKHLVSTLNEE